MHSLSQFSLEHHQTFKQWGNNYIVCLSIENENKLKQLIQKLHDNHIKFSVFTEPDIDNQITSIAIEGTDKASRLTSSLPLSLKEFNYN
jgi:pentose-5-phosphate-3-epimerase